MNKCVLFLCLILSLTSIKAQSMWEGGIFAGYAGYSGDINPTLTPRFQDFTPSLGLVARANLTNRIGFRTGITYFKLKGDDDNYNGRETRDFDFNTSLIEMSVLAEWEPFGSNRYYTDAAGNVGMDKLISPYIYLGVGLLGGVLNTNFSNYTGGDEGVKAGIQKDRAYGNSLLGISFPIGLGMKFDLSEGFTVAVEGAIRGSFTDYLDGISYAAGPDAKDIYMNLGVVVYRRFGNPRRWR